MPDRRTPTPPGPWSAPHVAGGELGEAHAPYNFVPLPARAASSPAPPSADRYHHPDRYTGHIDLAIEALTPLYVRGTVGPDDTARESKETPDFFAPTGRPAIPGSSLRGMVRTLVEIVGAAAPRYVADSHFAFRAVAERVSSSLTRTYRSRLGEQRVQAGYLVRRGGSLFIIPAQRYGGRQYWRVNREEARETLRLPAVAWQRRRVYFRPPATAEGPPATGQQTTPAGVPLIGGFQPTSGERSADMFEGWVVLSGDIDGKKHGWLIAGPDSDAERVKVTEPDELMYRDGWSPALTERHAHDFPLLPESGEALPCFYTSWFDERQQEHLAIGHTRWFRLPYTHGVRSHLPPAMRRDDSVWDLAEAIFGRVGKVEQTVRGRIFVEEALLMGEAREPFEPEDLPQVLSSPKPTTFQHYLTQDAALASGKAVDMRHWDDPTAQLRGYKLYWHRPDVAGNWRETNPQRNPAGDSQGTRIRPIRPTSRFRGRIRFENLSAVELGALLFVLDLPPECRHRLGMGKPLGLGSVQITPTLRLDDRAARYRSLFATDGSERRWAEPEAQKSPSIDALKQNFASWLLGQMGGEGLPAAADAVDRAWATALAPLRAMLTWSAPSGERTAYMALGDFRGRPLLPDPLAVLRPGGAPPGQAAEAGRARPPAAPAPRVGGAAPARGDEGRRAVPPAGTATQATQREWTPERPATLEDLAQHFQKQGAPPQQSRGSKKSERAKREHRELWEQMRRNPSGPDDNERRG